eukprot:FR739377.1.p2 GENE.FR739377.1~~FR739377.1.p2  ORF type:complete len:123 (+),score=72.25 FR739377.1:839-1207(+)
MAAAVSDPQGPKPRGSPFFKRAPPPGNSPFFPLYEGVNWPLGQKSGQYLFPGENLFSPPQFPPTYTNRKKKKGKNPGGAPKGGGIYPTLLNLRFGPSPPPPFFPHPGKKTPFPSRPTLGFFF